MIITLLNKKTNKTMKMKNGKKFISFAYNCCIDNWEMQSQSYKQYCELYGNGETTASGEYKWDRYLERLERAEREEFRQNAISIFKEFSNIWKIIKIEQEEEQEELTM